MPHSSIWTLAKAFVLTAAMAANLGAVEPSEKLLPDTVKGFVSVTNMKVLVDSWNATKVGQLMQDPIMEPFREDLQRQFEEQWVDARDKLGLTIDDLRGVPAGEVALALIQPAPGQSALVLLVDVTGNQEKAQQMVQKATANLIEEGSKKRTEKIGNLNVDVFAIPKENPQDEQEPQRHAALLLQGDLLIVSTSPEAMGAVLQRQAGAAHKTLADVPAFQAAMKRCTDDSGKDNVPQIRWFLEPFGYAETVRSAIPERDRRPGKPLTETLRNAGFTAISGMGGYLSFASEGYEFIHRTLVSAPKPYEKSMRMLSFPNEKDFVPQTWVPRDVATYTTTFVDIVNAFDNLAPLADEYIGEPGAWEDVLKGLLEDKHGPQVDLRSELVKHLGTQVTIVTDFAMPISTTSERILIAIQVKDEAAVAKALEKLLQADEAVVLRGDLPGLEKLKIWEAVPPEEKPLVPQISLDAIPVFPGDDPAAQEPVEEDVEGPGLLPNAAITVTNGQLFVSSHLDFLVKILQGREERETLASAIDFQIIGKKVEELSQERCAWVFSRTDKEYRATYELIRQGKMPESETMLGRALNTILGAGKKGVLRQQELDGSKLPDFDVVRRYLGTAGGFGVSEQDGWFFKGFMVSRDAE
ncbi:MAG: hypothetical protein ACYC6Y_01525 [Thermoguttaceae bacterium]